MRIILRLIENDLVVYFTYITWLKVGDKNFEYFLKYHYESKSAGLTQNVNITIIF